MNPRWRWIIIGLTATYLLVVLTAIVLSRGLIIQPDDMINDTHPTNCPEWVYPLQANPFAIEPPTCINTTRDLDPAWRYTVVQWYFRPYLGLQPANDGDFYFPLDALIVAALLGFAWYYRPGRTLAKKSVARYWGATTLACYLLYGLATIGANYWSLTFPRAGKEYQCVDSGGGLMCDAVGFEYTGLTIIPLAPYWQLVSEPTEYSGGQSRTYYPVDLALAGIALAKLIVPSKRRTAGPGQV